DGDLPNAGAHRRPNGFAAFWNVEVGYCRRRIWRLDKFRLSRCSPAFSLRNEGGLLCRLEVLRFAGNFAQKLGVLFQTEIGVVDVEMIFAMCESIAYLEQFRGGYRKEPDLIEETQKPGCAA